MAVEVNSGVIAGIVEPSESVSVVCQILGTDRNLGCRR